MLKRFFKGLFKTRKRNKKYKERFVQTLDLDVPMSEYVGYGVNE